jgi:hypothetical protein
MSPRDGIVASQIVYEKVRQSNALGCEDHAKSNENTKRGRFLSTLSLGNTISTSYRYNVLDSSFP